MKILFEHKLVGPLDRFGLRGLAVLMGISCLAGARAVAETTVTIEKKKSDAFYSPFGKRDPFRVPTVGGLGEDASVGPLQRFHVDQFRLRAILRGLGEPKAMFQDPKGRSHIVRQGDLIGIERATVSRIIKSEVILTERTYNYLGKESLLEKVIALPQDTDLDPLQLVNLDSPQDGDRGPAQKKNYDEDDQWAGEVRRTEPAAVRPPPPQPEPTPAAPVTPVAPKSQDASAASTPSQSASASNQAPVPVQGINEPSPQNLALVPGAAVPGAGTPETGNASTPVDATNSVRDASSPLPAPTPVPLPR